MSTEISLEVNGIVIRVSRSSPDTPAQAAALPLSVAATESSSSSFELVEGERQAEVEGYIAEAGFSPPPYPLQGPGPSAVSALGSPAQQSPIRPASGQSRPRRSLFSSPPGVPEYPLQGPPGPEEETQDFPPLPEALRNTCRGLRGGSLSWVDRAERAWKAGCCAKLLLRGTIRFPDASQPTGLANRFYCILRAEGLQEPALVRSFHEYRAIVGSLSGSTSVSQAFPSESEARLYFAGACLTYPL